MYMRQDYFPSKLKDETPRINEGSLSSSQNTSTWMAKRQRSKVEKDLEILKNRINLLSQVEIKTKKKVKEVKTKTERIIELKQAIEAQKQKRTILSEEQLHLESIKKRKKKQASLVNLRESLKQLKIEESQEIKKIKHENELKLKLIRDDISQKNKEKKIKIKNDLEISKKRIDKFWELKQKQFWDQHLLEIYEQEAIKKIKESEMTDLEKKESELLKKLDNTQIIHNHLYEKLENAMVLTSKEFFKLYGREKKPHEEHLTTKE